MDFFPPQSHLGVFSVEVAPSAPAEGQAMGFSLNSEPDGRAGDGKSNSLGPKKQRGAVSVGEERVHGAPDPLATAARVLGIKNTKASSESIPVPAAPLLPGPIPGFFTKPVGAGVLPCVVLFYRTVNTKPLKSENIKQLSNCISSLPLPS